MSRPSAAPAHEQTKEHQAEERDHGEREGGLTSAERTPGDLNELGGRANRNGDRHRMDARGGKYGRLIGAGRSFGVIGRSRNGRERPELEIGGAEYDGHDGLPPTRLARRVEKNLWRPDN